MLNEKSTVVPRGEQLIDLDQVYEVRYWCQSLGCTEPQLRWAVQQAGPMVANVERLLPGGHPLSRRNSATSTRASSVCYRRAA
jgi:Protein of unknown function (DUF3606)